LDGKSSRTTGHGGDRTLDRAREAGARHRRSGVYRPHRGHASAAQTGHHPREPVPYRNAELVLPNG
jgi:hypothetical protein